MAIASCSYDGAAIDQHHCASLHEEAARREVAHERLAKRRLGKATSATASAMLLLRRIPHRPAR